MKFFQEEFIKNFPDCYNKQPTSNNYKLMELLKYDNEKFRMVLQELADSLNLENATGYTLNLYGDMVGQNRGLANDEQYKVLIKTKLTRNRCNADYKSIVNCVCQILNCSPSDILLEEIENQCAVRAEFVPLEKILAADLTPSQFTQILNSLLPAGITLESSLYSGTFMFSDSEMEASTDAGFCQNEGEDYGGYFGILSDDESTVVLPI